MGGRDGLEYDFSPERGYNDSPSCLRLRSGKCGDCLHPESERESGVWRVWGVGG